MIPRLRALFTLLDARTHGAFSREYEFIIQHQWEPAARIREQQFSRLTALLRHADKNVPFYGKRFAEYGVRVAEIKDFADFERVPSLTKSQVVANADQLLSTVGSRSLLTRKVTGGSTGERVVFYRDGEAMARNFAHVLRNHTWTGLDLGQTHVFLWGAHFDLRAQQRLSNRVVNFCLRQRWLDAFRMNPASMSAYHERLRRWKPRLLSSYVTAATTLADYLHDVGASHLDVPAVATSAEVLFPERRKRIEERIGREVYDRFGCREVGNTAHECSAHDGLHVNAEHVLAEVVDARGRATAPGSEGEILYTSLGNYCFPLIRYRVGDYAVGGRQGEGCACGRGLPKIRQIRGRVSDMLIAPDGTKIHGEYFSHLFYKTPAVREFRVVQEAIDQLDVWVRVQDTALPPDEERYLQRELASVFGPEMRITIRAVDEIPKTASGKHRFTESRVGSLT